MTSNHFIRTILVFKQEQHPEVFMSIQKVVIVGGSRIPFCRSMGKYMAISNQELLEFVMKDLVQKFNLGQKEVGEVCLGALIKHSSDWNLARETVLGSGLNPSTPAFDIQQACGTSLEATILIANKIALGQIESGIAGGSDTNSDLPIVFSKRFRHLMLKNFKSKTMVQKLKIWKNLKLKDLKPNAPVVLEPRTKLSMGQSCEQMAQEWKISRQEQDQLAFESHRKAAKAYEEGFYKKIITPFQGVNSDNNMRASTTVEKLSQLRTVFDKSNKATLTAGNSTPLTDGASATFLCSEAYAKKHGLPILAYFSHGQTAAVDFVGGEGLLMAPAFAVPKMLERAQLKLQDFDFYEIHEAFAAQTLCTLKAWESESFCKNKLGLSQALGSIDRSKLNVKGGSLALGHPFAATGSRIVTALAHIINDHGRGRGLISVCTAGGMGVTAIIEK